MMDSAIVFKWSRAVSGREEKALEAWTKAMTFFGTAAHEGKCGEAISFMGTDGHSLLIIPGEYEPLAELVRTEEFRELYTTCVFAVPDLGYQFGAFGQGVQDYMARWARIGHELAFM